MQGTVVNQEDSLEVTRTDRRKVKKLGRRYQMDSITTNHTEVVSLKINCFTRLYYAIDVFDKIVVISLEYSFVIILDVLKPSISRFHHDLTIT